MAGELFLWNKDRDLLKTVGAVPEVVDVIASSQGLFAVAVYSNVIHIIGLISPYNVATSALLVFHKKGY